MDAGEGAARLAELREAARGWHTVQLAVLGFIGLCGVLQEVGGGDGPRWLQILAGVLVLVALVVACVAIVLVATAAWPLDVGGQPGGGGDRALHAAASRVRRGMALTFVALAILALATSSSWWPDEAAAPAEEAAPGAVEVTTRAGVLCGVLRTADRGALALDVGGRRIVLALADVVALRAAGGCPG